MQQYGFRASLNLAELLDRNSCWDNLGIDRRDLSLLVGTASAGVQSSDYQNCYGLTDFLESQITTQSALPGPLLTNLQGRIRNTGDTNIQNLSGSALNNDRAYIDSKYRIYSASSQSYFSPIKAPDYSSGGQYLSGTVAFPVGLQVTGLNYQGVTKNWSSYFVRYPRYAQVTDSGNTQRYAPLYLAPPAAVSSNVLWLDSEYSSISAPGGSVASWNDVQGRGSAAQATSSRQPKRISGELNGRAGVQFDGVSQYLDLSFNTALIPTAATLIAVFSLSTTASSGDTDYAILTSLNNSSSSWSGSWGLFTSNLVSGFPSYAPVNGTHVVSIRISNTYGLEYRLNGVRRSYLAPGAFSYDVSGSYQIGGRRPFSGSLYALALYNTILDDKELRSQETYFRWRYGFDFPNPDADSFDYTQLINDEQFEYLQLEDGSLLSAYSDSPSLSYIPTTEFLQMQDGSPITLEDMSVLENA